jgi:hypothetical protein
MKKALANKNLPVKQATELLKVLQKRFEENALRHQDLPWADVQAQLSTHVEKLWSLNEMEKTGGEPDVVCFNKQKGVYLYVDCSPETPKGRTSVCYDPESLAVRKENKPKDSAVGMATAMGIELLSEEEYRQLQKLGEFDLKTSSWVRTPEDIRKLGGALFCDRRFGHVFVYHNGAQSYYAARGFRGSLKL